jgi:hypothetical protein
MLLPPLTARGLRAGAFTALFLAGCTGSIAPGDRPSPGDRGGPAPMPGDPRPAPVGSTAMTPDRASAACKAIDPGPSPLRRLSRAEYDNTVRDLLGDQSAPARSFPADERSLGFDNSAEARSVSALLADRYVSAAETLAKGAVAKLSTILPCDPQKAGEMVCLGKFLDTFARRAWRRPLEAEERQNLQRAFMEGRGASFGDGIQSVIQVLLLSPQFLYRFEQGVPVPGSKYAKLTPWELASRLSYLLWGSMPDDALLTAAESGHLATATDVLEQARRMLADPRAAATLAGFSDQWLRLEELADLDKEAMVFPNFKNELREPLRLETQKLIEEVVWKGDGKLSTLLTAPYTFMNGPLAQYYGAKGPSGDAFVKVPVDPTRQIGLLGHAGLLAVLGVPDTGLTSLVYRGAFVRERLLCEKLPDPPANAAAMNPPFTDQTTAREWSEARQAITLCGSCHQQMDPIGFGLEHFDAVGLWRDQDRGKAIDTHGRIEGTDIAGPFDGEIELSRKLAGSQQVHDCLAVQWFRYGYGREETGRDTCTTETLKRVFKSSGGSVRELLLALTQTDAFLYRGGQP